MLRNINNRNLNDYHNATLRLFIINLKEFERPELREITFAKNLSQFNKRGITL